MRVAVYHNLPSGGANRAVFEIVKRLSRRHTVDLYCPATADIRFCNVRPHVNSLYSYDYGLSRLFKAPLGRLNNAARLFDLWRMESLSRGIANDIDRRSYDVAFVHPCMVSQAPSVIAFLRTRSVYYCQEPLRSVYEPRIARPYHQVRLLRQTLDVADPMIRAYRWALRRVDRRNLRSATTVLTNSHFTSEAVLRIYGVAARVARLGVDAGYFRPLEQARQGLVVSVGSLRPEKGFDFIVKAIATMPAESRPMLLVVSNFALSAEREYLERLAQTTGVQLKFKTRVSDDELVLSYATASLTAYAPIREPLGLVSLESQACETPVVAVAEGGIPETLVHGRTGLLTSRDPAEFGTAIGTLLGDKELRAQYGRQGRAYVRSRWDWEQSVCELDAVLSTTAASHTKREPALSSV